MKLDNSRTSKTIPKILYDKIKLYVRESLLHDHKKLIEGYEYLNELKPNLRQQLIRDLFTKFIDLEFPHLFHYDY